MQIERQEFWIYRLIVRKLKLVLWVALLASMWGLYNWSAYRYEYYKTAETGYLENCLDKYFDKYKPENGYLVEAEQLLRIEMVTDQKDALMKQ